MSNVTEVCCVLIHSYLSLGYFILHTVYPIFYILQISNYLRIRLRCFGFHAVDLEVVNMRALTNQKEIILEMKLIL